MDRTKRKPHSKYGRVMSRVHNTSRSSLDPRSLVTRYEKSSARLGGKTSVSNVSSSVFSDLPTVLHDYVPELPPEKPVKISNVVKPRKTLRSLDPSLSPHRSSAKPAKPSSSATERPRVSHVRRKSTVSLPQTRGTDLWSDEHVRQCYSSRSHTKLKELKDEINSFREKEKQMSLRAKVYKQCGIVLDDVGHVCSDKAVQAEADDPLENKRQRLWLSLIERQDLLLRGNLKYRSFEVCAAHFSPEDFRTVTKLMPNALPCRNLPSKADNHDMQIEEEINAKIAEDISENSQDSPIEKFDVDHKRNSEDQLPDPEEVKKKLMADYVRVKTEYDTKKLVTVCAPLNNDEITELLVEWQSNMDNRNNNKEYYHFCLNIFLSSPQIYTSLRSLLRLPNQRILSRVVLHSKPQIDKRILTCLSSKLQSLPVKAKYCTLCVDQMPLKPHLFYNITQDEIIGFKTHAAVTREVVRHAYVAVLRGIVVDWSQPIAHCMVAKSCSNHKSCSNDKSWSNDLHRWIMEVINVLYGRGIEVKAIVSKLEIGLDTNVKTDKPYTSFKPYSSSKIHKIYHIFDVPKLISSVKHYLMENDFNDSGKTISWKYIEEAYFYQKRHGLKLLPEVTRGHLDIKSNVDQRTRDKQTAHIFSQSMVAAINVLKMQAVESTENMESSNAEATSKFVETVSKTFNVLNSSSIKHCDKYQRPFTGSVSQSKVLAEALEMFDRIRVVSKDPENILFSNIQVSIQAIQCLFEDLHEEGIPFILTQRLNREPLDDIVKEVKEVTGKSSNPTALRFLRAYSKVILSRFLKKSPMRNKQGDLADLLLVGNSVLLQESLPRPPTSMVSIGPDTDYRFDLPEKDSLTYVTSYLLYKCSTKHVCPVLTKIMNISPDLYRVHPQFKAINSTCVSFYAHLKLPPKLFENYVKDLDEVFKENFEQIMSRKPANVLLKVLHDVEPCTPCLDFNVEYLLILFTRLRIYQILRYNSQCVRHPPFLDYKTNRVVSKFRYMQFRSLN